MRHRARTDRNHSAIRDGLRRVTVVEDTSDIGRGWPDLVARHVATGEPIFLEVKNPGQPPSRRRLTVDETSFASRWGGVYCVVLTLNDALEAIGAIT